MFLHVARDVNHAGSRREIRFQSSDAGDSLVAINYGPPVIKKAAGGPSQSVKKTVSTSGEGAQSGGSSAAAEIFQGRNSAAADYDGRGDKSPLPTKRKRFRRLLLTT